MSASVEVPRAVVESAREHFARTGRPYLQRQQRRPDETSLVVLPSVLGYRLAIDPESSQEELFLAAAGVDSQGDLISDLARAAAAELEGLPQRFTCEGSIVGLLDISEAAVIARGPVALACAGWAIRQRGGFCLRLQFDDTE